MSGNVQETAYAAEMRRQQFSALLKLAPQAIVVLDSDSRVREWNPAAVELLGWERDDVMGRPLPGLPQAGHRHELESLWAQLQATGRAGAVSTVHLHRDGPGVSVEVYMAPIQDVDGSFAGVVATVSRLDGPAETSRGGSRSAVQPPMPQQWRRTQASDLGPLQLDDVTGLPGRRWLQQRLAAVLAPGEERAVAVLDVDAFALVNQGYGPEAGDTVLRELAARLARTSGAAAVGHWQADEFVCIVDGPDVERAMDRLVALLTPAAREPFEVEAEAVRLSVSVGMASTPEVPLPALFRSASAAMAVAKSRGRDCAVWFDEAMAAPVGGSGLRLANDLHRGLLQDEMRLHFQPIVELATNDVDGVEALLRWERPGVGLLAPGAFIEIAERTGQIVSLGRWVIDHACRAAVDFEAAAASPVRVSINVSARQLSDPGLVGMLDDALTRTGCPPQRIAIEVTETAVLHDIASATAVLETIKSLGVDLDLDDFGTGYSSLLYLRHFPVDRVKIDRSFVSGLGTSIADTAIVASTIALAHSVGMRAVAEGVETDVQLTMLRQMGCDFAQGYLLSHPLPEDQVVPWLQQQLPSRLVARDTRAGRGQDSTGRSGAADKRDDVSDQRDDVADERDLAGDLRDVAGQDRDSAGDERDSEADQRDLAGDRRDQIADQREQLADERDVQANRREGASQHQETSSLRRGRGVSALARREAARDRTRASQDRVAEVGDRLLAERDRDDALAGRGVGAEERLQADQDRTLAQIDRDASAHSRRSSSLDALTGGLLRDAGRLALRAEMASALGRAQPLTLVHAVVEAQAGPQHPDSQMDADAVMIMVANALGSCLRASDVLVREGPRDFLCVLPGSTAAAAAALLAPLHTDLAGPPRLVTTGLGYAELAPKDSAEDLIERARADCPRL